MSAINHIDETIANYESIRMKPKNPLPGILLAIAGTALIIMNYTVEGIASNANLSSGLVLLGTLAAIAGIIMLLIIFLGKKGIPVYIPTGQKLDRREFYYDTSLRDKVCAFVTKGDFSSLSALPRSESSSLMAVVYSTPGNDIALAQVLEFVPHFYQPLDEPIVFGKGKYTPLKG